MARPQHSEDEVAAARERLLAVALHICLTEGEAALSFRRLAEVAGISHSLPYRYFESKEGLLGAIRVVCTRHFEQFVRQRENARATPLQRIRQIAEAYLQFVNEHSGEYQMVFASHPPAPASVPELLVARRSLFDHAVEVVQAAVDSGAMRGDALTLAHLFWVSMHGLMTLHVGGQLLHGRQMSELIEPMIERLIQAGAPCSPEPVRRKSPGITPPVTSGKKR